MIISLKNTGKDSLQSSSNGYLVGYHNTETQSVTGLLIGAIQEDAAAVNLITGRHVGKGHKVDSLVRVNTSDARRFAEEILAICNLIDEQEN